MRTIGATTGLLPSVPTSEALRAGLTCTVQLTGYRVLYARVIELKKLRVKVAQLSVLPSKHQAFAVVGKVDIR